MVGGSFALLSISFKGFQGIDYTFTGYVPAMGKATRMDEIDAPSTTRWYLRDTGEELYWSHEISDMEFIKHPNGDVTAKYKISYFIPPRKRDDILPNKPISSEQDIS